jgi:hypothetical protein
MPDIPAHWLHEETLGPREVGKIFDVDPRTVTRWADAAMIGYFRTPHGMRRFPVCEVKRLMQNQPPEDAQLLKDLVAEDKARFHEKWQGGWRRHEKIFRRRDEVDE